MTSESLEEDEIWSNENICDFCRTGYEESPYQAITELAYTGDQPAVQICSTCLVEGTLQWQEGDFDSFSDQSVTEQVKMEIYSRGLDIKVHKDNRPDAIDLGEVPE